MYIYITIFLLSAFLIKIGESRKSKKFSICFLLALFLPSMLAGFRDVSVGTDTQEYYKMYLGFEQNDLLLSLLFTSNTEPLFVFLSIISTKIGGFQFLLFTYQFLTIFFVYLTAYKYRKYISIWLVFLIYFFLFYNASLNIMRQCLAVSYIAYITTFLFDGNNKKFIVLALLSLCIHTSAIIGAIFIFIIFRLTRYKGQKLILLSFLFFIALFLLGIFFKYAVSLLSVIGIGRFGEYLTYVSGDSNSVLGITDLLLRLVFLGISIYAYASHIINKRISLIYIFFIIVEIAMLFLGLYSKFLYRIALYFTEFHIYFIPLIVDSGRFTFDSRNVLKFGVLSLVFIYWFYLNIYRLSNMTVPYHIFSL